MTVRIVPAILPRTREQLEHDFTRVHALETEHNKVHIDVADGLFVPNTTYPLHHDDVFTELDCLPHGDSGAPVQFSVHCMVAHPEQVVPLYIRAGASEVIVHIESFHSLDLLEVHCKQWNVRVVLAALLHTPVSRLVEAMERTHIDRVLLMSITNVGIQGSPFDRHVLTHMRELRRLYPSVRIAVDGGINIETLGDAVAAGAEECVVGSHLINAKNIDEVYERLVSITQS